MSGNHDLGYKQLFAHPEMVRDLLAGFTEIECFRNLVPAAFERLNASYVSEQFSERHGDMVWRVRLADHIVYVYLLLEFQSQCERWMALRMQVYVGLLYQDLVKRHEFSASTGLPPVLPVVFYNGKAPWSASEELRDLVRSAPDELAPFQASQRYLLIDQNSIDPAGLVGARNFIAPLFRLELSDSPGVLMEVLATLRAWLAGEDQLPLRRSIASWIARLQKRELCGMPINEVQALLEDEAMAERFQRKFATWNDYLLDQGWQKGCEDGKQMATRALLKRLLARRFGDIPADAATRIDHAAEPEMERWIDRVLDADSVEAVISS